MGDGKVKGDRKYDLLIWTYMYCEVERNVLLVQTVKKK